MLVNGMELGLQRGFNPGAIIEFRDDPYRLSMRASMVFLMKATITKFRDELQGGIWGRDNLQCVY